MLHCGKPKAAGLPLVAGRPAAQVQLQWNGG